MTDKLLGFCLVSGIFYLSAEVSGSSSFIRLYVACPGYVDIYANGVFRGYVTPVMISAVFLPANTSVLAVNCSEDQQSAGQQFGIVAAFDHSSLVSDYFWKCLSVSDTGTAASIGNWTNTDYNDKSWPQATVIGAVGDSMERMTFPAYAKYIIPSHPAKCTHDCISPSMICRVRMDGPPRPVRDLADSIKIPGDKSLQSRNINVSGLLNITLAVKHCDTLTVYLVPCQQTELVAFYKLVLVSNSTSNFSECFGTWCQELITFHYDIVLSCSFLQFIWISFNQNGLYRFGLDRVPGVKQKMKWSGEGRQLNCSCCQTISELRFEITGASGSEARVDIYRSVDKELRVSCGGRFFVPTDIHTCQRCGCCYLLSAEGQGHCYRSNDIHSVLELDGSDSYPYNNDVIYHWHCVMSYQQQPIKLLTSLLAVAASHSCFLQDQLQNISTSKVTFKANSLNFTHLPTMFSFYLYVTVAAQTSLSPPANLLMVRSAVPKILMKCTKNCDVFDVGKELSVRADCINCRSDELLSYLWSVESECDRNKVQSIDWTNNSTTGSRNTTLSLNAGVFSTTNVKQFYLLQLTVSRADNSTSRTQYSFMIEEG